MQKQVKQQKKLNKSNQTEHTKQLHNNPIKNTDTNKTKTN